MSGDVNAPWFTSRFWTAFFLVLWIGAAAFVVWVVAR